MNMRQIEDIFWDTSYYMMIGSSEKLYYIISHKIMQQNFPISSTYIVPLPVRPQLMRHIVMIRSCYDLVTIPDS